MKRPRLRVPDPALLKQVSQGGAVLAVRQGLGIRMSWSLGFSLIAFLGALLPQGCTPSATPRQSSDESAAVAQERQEPYVTEPSSRPARLVEERWKRIRQVHVDPLSLDLESVSVLPSDVGVTTDSKGLHVSQVTEPSAITIPLDESTDRYNTLVLKMRTGAGETGNVTWFTDLSGDDIVGSTVAFSLFPDGEFHEYRIALQSAAPGYWHGILTRIVLTPSDVPTDVEIAGMQLVYVPPEGPERLTVGEETREVVFGTQPPWTVTVPPGGTFEVALGVGDRVGRGRMIVRMKAPQSPEMELLNEKVYPGLYARGNSWAGKKIDLNAFAGQQVTFTLEVDHLNTKHHDYFYWGDPIVYGDAPEKAIPVILISCDTLRADHLSCYGYKRETTPNLDAWAAQEAVLFENAIVPETWTMPSHASMLSGLYPKTHGATADSVLAESIVTLADVAREEGYLAAGFTGFQYWLAPSWGFAQGFDLYDVPTVPLRKISDTNIRASQWLSAHPTPSLFLFLHNGDCHQKISSMGYTTPYDPGNPSFLHFAKAFDPPPSFKRVDSDFPPTEEFMSAANRGEITISDEEKAYCIALYDDCIRMVDYEITRFFDELKRLNLYDQSLIILTSDHGEEFAEHGLYGHSQVFDECARVPLLIRFPNGEYGGTRISELVQNIDIFPTVLDVIDPSRDAGQIDGRSLLPVIRDGQGGRSFAYIQRMSQQAVRTPQYKLIYLPRHSTSQFYDLQRDPEELVDLHQTPPPEMATLEQKRKDFFAERPDGWHFSLSYNRTPVSATIAVNTEDTIVSSPLAQGDRRDFTHNINRTPHRVELLWDQFTTEDELVLRTANSESSLSLDIKSAPDSNVPILVYLGQDAPIETKDLRMVLDHTARSFPQPDPIPTMDSEQPTIAIWYESPAHKRTSVPELTEEDRENLNALGYGQ